MVSVLCSLLVYQMSLKHPVEIITITMLITQIKELIVGQLQLKMWWIILVVLSQKCMLLQNQNLFLNHFLKNRHSVGLVVAQ
ncbi:hypothetical protein DW797_02155 [Ruminococcus sp. AM31-32]|nr:hypothetical protein DW797_02155 [Ruminococcus sp. AM31-32]